MNALALRVVGSLRRAAYRLALRTGWWWPADALSRLRNRLEGT